MHESRCRECWRSRPIASPRLQARRDRCMERSRVDSAFACVDAITDAALLQGDAAACGDRRCRRSSQRARTFRRSPSSWRSAVDAGIADRLRETQAQLVDAYLEASRGEEARIIAEHLVRAEPASEAHADRLRRALTMPVCTDPEQGARAGSRREAETRRRTRCAVDGRRSISMPGYAEVTTAQPLPEVDVFVNPGTDAERRDVRVESVRRRRRGLRFRAVGRRD